MSLSLECWITFDFLPTSDYGLLAEQTWIHNFMLHREATIGQFIILNGNFVHSCNFTKMITPWHRCAKTRDSSNISGHLTSSLRHDESTFALVIVFSPVPCPNWRSLRETMCFDSEAIVCKLVFLSSGRRKPEGGAAPPGLERLDVLLPH